MPAPANDLCASATVIGSLPYSESGVDNTLATESGDDPLVVDAGTGTLAGAATLFKTQFWKYTPGSNQRIHISAPTFGVSIGVFTGSCGALVEVASYGEDITLDLIGGVTYTIMTGNYANAGQTFNFSVAVSTAPGNQIQSTAKDISNLLPFTETVDLSLATDTGSIYYKIVGVADDVIRGFFAYSAAFNVGTRVYSGPYDIYDGNVADPDVNATNFAVQYPVHPGDIVYFAVFKRPGPAAGNVTIDAVTQPNEAAPAGTLTVLNDNFLSGFPAALIDPETGEILRFVDVPAGEFADVLDSGVMLLEDIANERVQLRDDQFALITTVGTLGFDTLTHKHQIRMSPGLQEFFVGRKGGGGHNATIHRVNATGTVVASWTLPSAGMTLCAPNNDGSVVYVSGNGGSSDAPIKAWNTAGAGSFGSDLIAGQGAAWTSADALVLANGNVAVLWLNPAATDQAMVKVITPTGTVVGTYTKFTTGSARLLYDRDTRTTHFWLWTHSDDIFSIFEKIDASALTVSDSVPPVREFEGGIWGAGNQPATATPDARFGNPDSCPAFFTRVGVGAGGGGGSSVEDGMIGPYVWVHWPLRTQV